MHELAHISIFFHSAALSPRILRLGVHFLPSHSVFASWCPVRQGFTYVGVEQTQDELEVRLFSGDERHLCGVVAVPWFVGRSLVVSARARCCEVRKASLPFCSALAFVCGQARPKADLPVPAKPAILMNFKSTCTDCNTINHLLHVYILHLFIQYSKR